MGKQIADLSQAHRRDEGSPGQRLHCQEEVHAHEDAGVQRDEGGESERQCWLVRALELDAAEGVARHDGDAQHRPERHDRGLQPVQHQEDEGVPVPQDHADQRHEVGRKQNEGGGLAERAGHAG